MTEAELKAWDEEVDLMITGFISSKTDRDLGKRLLGLISAYRDLEEKLRIVHMDISMIRRSTDDSPELSTINRMAREALRKIEDLPK